MQPVDIDEDTLQDIARHDRRNILRADNAQQFQAIYREINSWK